jgi:hypothetical protein
MSALYQIRELEEEKQRLKSKLQVRNGENAGESDGITHCNGLGYRTV